MPLPGENTFGGRKGSYTPGVDPNETPFKPVPLAFQQADGTMPADDTDQNRNAKQARARTRRAAEDARQKRKKVIGIAVLIIIALIIILAIVLPLAICLGTDYCSSSSASVQPTKTERPYQAQLRATMTAPVISDPGNPPFGEYLNATMEVNATTTAASVTEISVTIASTSAAPRLRRDTNDATIVNGNDTLVNRFSALDQYLMDKISSPLLESIMSSPLCQGIDCTDLAFDDFRLENDLMTSRFSFKLGSDEPLSIDPLAMQVIRNATAQNFSEAFSGVFPGYRLGDVDLSFDLIEFCNFTSIYCSNFTDINDTFPTLSPPLTTTVIDTTTIPDRSVLLPDNETFQLFNVNLSDQSATAVWTSSAATNVASTTVTPVVVKGMADCSKYGFTCTDQRDRVGTRERCDGVIQCADGSDEQFCEQCRTSFSCPNGDGSWMCLRGKVVCDGKMSCPTDFDEGPIHCKSTCLSSEYRCRNSSACIPKRWLCDGDAQCPQGDDELNCNVPSKCNNNAFFCAADLRCIPTWNTCNGVSDCSDGADEARCSCLDCSGNRVALCSGPYGKCILETQMCDGNKDCPNGEDEHDCPS